MNPPSTSLRKAQRLTNQAPSDQSWKQKLIIMNISQFACEP